ncbi:MAG TPA: penicillin-binding protein 2 [Firmicutes bacterium]|nr:penicillin-binding protein 2 [Bacillota bacterium]
MLLQPGRFAALVVVFFLIFFCLGFQLIKIQIIDSSRFMQLALNQRSEVLRVGPPRGLILDRNYQSLTEGTREKAIVVFPRLLQSGDSRLIRLRRGNDVALRRFIETPPTSAAPFIAETGVSTTTQQEINQLNNPGIVCVDLPLRYDRGGLACHLVGYTSLRDNKGVFGVEKMLDRYLAADDPGLSIVALVDANRRLIPGLGYRIVENRSRPSVVLTIDKRIQRIVDRVMDRMVPRGACVVMRSDTGEVLAMSSRPKFDPNDVASYLGRPDSPLLNRALAAYPVGSVFKVVVAAAALEEGITTEREVFTDPGYITVGSNMFRCYKFDEGGHGQLDFTKAFADSCNVAFIEVGERLGRDKLVDYAERFGFARPTGIGLAEEEPGRLPGGWNMSAGDIANMSIGQGEMLGTPLQVTAMAASIANGGILVRPRVVREIRDASGKVVRRFDPPPDGAGYRVVSEATAKRVARLMRVTVVSGTGRNARVEGWEIAGKTGSPETGKLDADGKSISHAWFAGYGKGHVKGYGNIGLACTVLVEEGGSGGDVAARVFHDIMKGIKDEEGH